MDATKDHKRVSLEGKACGFQMVRLTEPAIAQLVVEGEPDERCKSCAFRLGTVPNGCIQTQADAMKAVVEGVPFMCHQADRGERVCHGWYAATVSIKRAEHARGYALKVTCPWDFSPPDPSDSPQLEGPKA